MFQEWLTNKRSSTRTNTVLSHLRSLSMLLMRKKIIKKRIVDITEVAVIDRIIKDITNNSIRLATSHKHNYLSAIMEYKNYLIDSNKIDARQKEKVKPNNDISLSFFDWLAENEHLAVSTVRSYVAAVNYCQRYCDEQNMGNVLFTDVEKISENICTINILLNDDKFAVLNNNQHHRFSAALEKYKSYLELYTNPLVELEPRDDEISTFYQEVLEYIKTSNNGVRKEDILLKFSSYSTHRINLAIEASHSVKVLDRYFYKGNIEDFDLMSDILLEIIERQFNQYAGYTSAKQLYAEARFKLDDFFFYNDKIFDSQKGIYDLAYYLFGKESFKGKSYIFKDRIHIWREEPDYPKQYYGLLVKYGREHNNVFTCKEAIDFLDWAGSGSPKTLFYRIVNEFGKQYFYQIDTDVYVVAEAIKIDSVFRETLRNQLYRACEGGYVAFDDLSDYFYDSLPQLPSGVKWSEYLIEDILDVNNDLGFTTLTAASGTKTRPAVIVDTMSTYKSLSDVIYNEIENDFNLPYEMSNNEFWEYLLEKGYVHGQEKRWSVHKTVEKDLRFFWTDNYAKVTIS